MSTRRRVMVLIFASLLLALIFCVYPLPPAFALVRPELLCLLMIYWIMDSPQHFGMLFGWCIGLVQDVAENTVWGAHALALMLVAYVCQVSYQRMRSYSVWHQSMWIFVFLGMHQVIANWVQSMAGYHAQVYSLLMPAVVTALFWPLLILVMRQIRVVHIFH